LLEQVLKSAMGNAEDRGARGSAFPIKRRYAHIVLTLSDMEEETLAQTAQ
jgi:ribosomal protein L22